MFTEVNEITRMKQSSNSIPLETNTHLFPSRQDICEHQMLLPVSLFPTGFLQKADWSLCYPSGTTYICIK